MFEDNLFTSKTQRYPRGWTALVSLTIQTFLVGTLIVLPMLFPDALPFPALKKIVEIFPVPRTVQNETTPAIQHQHQDETRSEIIQVPQSVPTAIDQFNDLPPTRISGNSGPPDPTGIAGAHTEDPQMSALLHPEISVTPTIQKTQPTRWRVSGGVAQGLLIRDVKPIYPRLAQAAGVQGEVILQAVIGKDGRIENLHTISGNPLLVKAAVDAVQQWRYRPYLLNGEPVAVETQITVRFTMS
jgi:protein TonB